MTLPLLAFFVFAAGQVGVRPHLIPVAPEVLSKEQAAWDLFDKARNVERTDERLSLLDQFQSALGRTDRNIEEYRFFFLAMAHRWDDAFAQSKRMRELGYVSEGHFFDPQYKEILKDPRTAHELAKFSELQRKRLDELDFTQLGLNSSRASTLLRSLLFRDDLSDMELYRQFSSFSGFQKPRHTNRWFVDTIDFDSKRPGVGIVPISYFVYIPTQYRLTNPNPALIWVHGGWFSAPSARPLLPDINLGANNPLLSEVERRGYIEIIPLCYSAVTMGSEGNSKLFERILARVKQTLNVDDDRVYFAGHSDGGTSAFTTACEDPTAFAAFYPVNGWPRPEAHYRNLVSRPMESLTSEKDDLFIPASVLPLYKIAQSVHADWNLTLVPGGTHGAENFIGPYAVSLFDHMAKLKRNALTADKTWEMDADQSATVDWLKVLEVDSKRPRAPWHSLVSTPRSKRPKYAVELTEPAPQNENSGCVTAHYANNVFELQTSRIAKVRLLIHPRMVDLSKPVRVIANGREVFNAEVKTNRAFMVNNFLTHFDRSLVWVASIDVNIPDGP